MKERHLRFRWLLALLCVAVSPGALAYLDPGTGSIVLQGIIAAVAGVAVTAKLYWGRIRSFFSRGKKQEPKADSEQQIEEAGGKQ